MIVAFDEGIGDELDGFRIVWRSDRPRGNLLLIGYEETIEVTGNKGRRGRLGQDDVDDLFAIEIACVTEEGLFAVIVVVRPELVIPVPSPHMEPWELVF